jgi:hypothetical protein
MSFHLPFTGLMRGLVTLAAFACLPTSLLIAAEVPESLRACMTESDASRRLACFDQEMARLTSTVKSEKATAPVPSAAANGATTAPPSLSEEERFGLSDEQARKKEQVAEPAKLDRLDATVTALSKGPEGQLIVTLDNGQVWIQKAAETFVVKVGDTVTIKTTFIGSYFMTRGGSSTRVNRVK